MGQGANIIIGNFTDHVVQVAVTKERVEVDGTLSTTLQPASGLGPVYIESTDGDASHVTLSFSVSGDDGHAYVAATARFRRTGEHWEVDDHTSGAVGVKTAVKPLKQDVITIFLDPTVVTHHIRLHKHESGDRWECEMGSQGAEDWPELVAETCTQTVSPWCRTVTLRISNACGREFWLDGDQRMGGTTSWRDAHVASGGSWSQSFDVSGLERGQTWEYQITGFYDHPDRSSRAPLPPLVRALSHGSRPHARQPLPDPTFKITRSGG